MSSSDTKKVLLMGRAGAGKTSMRSIIFANYLARDTKRLTATNNIEHSHLRLLGQLVLSLWDCGGQDTFMENYFETQRGHIFRNSEVLIYVIEVRGSTLENIRTGNRQRETTKDFQYFKTTMESTRQFSPNAKIFTLVHKLDLVLASERERVCKFYSEEIQKDTEGLDMTIYGTSIWDETLFKAWSGIVCSLVSNLRELEAHLSHFCEIAEADEAVLFEKSTFLVLSHYTRRPHSDKHRFEKISNICKQFNLTCAKMQSNFVGLSVHSQDFSAYIDRFTHNTYILVVVTDKEIQAAATLCNIEYAREHFEQMAEQMKFGPSV